MRSDDVARYLQDHPEFFEEHADTLAEIHKAVQEKRPEIDYAAFKTQFDALYKVMNAINKLVLRLPSA